MIIISYVSSTGLIVLYMVVHLPGAKKNDIKLTHIRNVYRFFRFYIVKLESKYN